MSVFFASQEMGEDRRHVYRRSISPEYRSIHSKQNRIKGEQDDRVLLNNVFTHEVSDTVNPVTIGQTAIPRLSTSQ
jgi:hypothetical protein